jgi:hypothetical protein
MYALYAYSLCRVIRSSRKFVLIFCTVTRETGYVLMKADILLVWATLVGDRFLHSMAKRLKEPIRVIHHHHQ